MKNCIDCGAEAPDEATRCAECGRPFSYVMGSEPVESDVSAVMRRRPDGGVLLTCGGASMAASSVCLLVALVQDTTTYYGTDVAAMGRQWLFMLLAGGLFQLGLMLLLAGTVVRAIWFLPGAESKAIPAVNETTALQDTTAVPIGAERSPLTHPGDEGATV